MKERKRVFLLGGTGFIGSALTKQLSATQQMHDLMMLIHRKAPFKDLEQVNVNSGSLGSFDLSMLDQFRPETIIHLARMNGGGKWGRYWAATKGAWANARIVRHLGQQPTKPHVIYVSGTLVYGDCGATPVDEARPINPIAFAREYIKAEEPWMAALNKGTIPVTILRPPWIIGRSSWFLGFYLRNIIKHRMIPLFGKGANLMSLLDVEDCAGLIRHAVWYAEPGRCYNLFAPGACITQLEFAERLSAMTGAEVRKFEAQEIRRRYGQTMVEAFTFSNNSMTQYPEFISGYNFKYPSVEAMIRNNVSSELSVPTGS